MLPAHPQPRQNEILSSWMVRLAPANGFPLHTFYSNVLGYKAPIWNRDIDRHPAPRLLDVLSRNTGQSVEALRCMTLSAYENLLFESLPLIGDATWILPVGVFHRTHRLGGMQFCPLCLAQDSTPYYRRTWRLAFYVLCEFHHCVMQTHCPSCHAPVTYHRHGMGRKNDPLGNPMYLCHACHFDLRNSPPTFPAWSDSSSQRLLELTTGTFEEGTWCCGNFTPPCGVPFFEGLHALVSILKGIHGQRLRKVLSGLPGLAALQNMGCKKRELEHISVSDRLILLLTAFWMLDDWPRRFVQSCKDAHLTRSLLAERVDLLPFWLAEAANDNLDRRTYQPSATEIETAKTLLCANGFRTNAHNMRRILGVSADYARLHWLAIPRSSSD